MFAALLALFVLIEPQVLDPVATARALRQDDARIGALRALGRVPAADHGRFTESEVPTTLTDLAGDPKLSFADRVGAIRLLAHLRVHRASTLLAQLTASVTTTEETALAREAARALVRLGRGALLLPALSSPDPELRALSIESPTTAEPVCAAIADAWPLVRKAAARSLGRFEGQSCVEAALTRAMGDPDSGVLGAAIIAAGQARVASLEGPLRALVADPARPMPHREDALVSLSQLGEFETARRCLTTHLEKGGVASLAAAAVSALGLSDEPADLLRLRRALLSEAVGVQMRAAALLAERRDEASLPALKELHARSGARERESIAELISRLEVRSLPEDGAPIPSDDPAQDDD